MKALLEPNKSKIAVIVRRTAFQEGCHGIAIFFSMLLILLTEKHTLHLLKSAHQSTCNFFCRKVLLISGLEEVGTCNRDIRG